MIEIHSLNKLVLDGVNLGAVIDCLANHPEEVLPRADVQRALATYFDGLTAKAEEEKAQAATTLKEVEDNYIQAIQEAKSKQETAEKALQDHLNEQAKMFSDGITALTAAEKKNDLRVIKTWFARAQKPAKERKRAEILAEKATYDAEVAAKLADIDAT